MRQVSKWLIGSLVPLVAFGCGPVIADDPKANASKEFGEQILLKMTEPPAEMPKSSSQSSPEAVPQTQAPGAAQTTPLQTPATGPQSQLSSTGPDGTIRLQGRIEILREHPIVFSPLRRSNEDQSSASTGASSDNPNNSGSVASGHALADMGFRAASRSLTDVGYTGSHETRPGAQSGSLDTPKRETGSDASRQTYPKSFVGEWKGDVTIDQVDIDPLLNKELPKLFARIQGLVFVGRAGKLTIVFKQDGDQVSAEPAGVFEKVASDDKYAPPGEESPKTVHMLFGPVQKAPSVLFKSNTSELRINTVKALSDTDFEQQIVTDNQVENKDGSSYEIGQLESVFRFHTIDPKQLQFTLAKVSYAPGGRMKTKVIFHGTVTKQ